MLSQIKLQSVPMEYKSASNISHTSKLQNMAKPDNENNRAVISNGNGNSNKVSPGNEKGNIGNSSNGGSKKQRNVPFELTAYGTTPSGKPRLFVCQTCTRAFARLEHLRRHERSHTKEKPFSCGVCQRKFSRRDLLLRHAQKLHAGCADAITRLRRKSLKRKSVGSNDLEDDEGAIKQESGNSMSPHNSGEDVQFNLNLFNSGASPPPVTSKRNSAKDQGGINLQRKVFEQRHLRRGASFSAQSGANYAVGGSDFHDIYPGTDNIEFSTPQLLPSTSSEELSWLNNLNAIPGMVNKDSHEYKISNNLSSGGLRQPSITSHGNENPFPMDVSHHGSFSSNLNTPGNHRSDSLASTSSFNTLDSMGNMQYMVPTATISNQELSNFKNERSFKDYGYSFYDIPESMLSAKQDPSKQHYNPHSSLTPIRQEEDDASQHETNSNSNTVSNNFDLNFLNDIEDLTHEYDVNYKFMPNGYSFYGDSQSASSSGIGSNSPHVVTPPSGGMNFPMSNNDHHDGTLSQTQLLNIENDLKKKSIQRLNHFSRNKLFTNKLRYLINKALSKYPISGIMTPSIPSNERLEYYLTTFINIFLAHFPFIHVSKLNEYEIMSMTVNEDETNESARVCLPLLIATIGALLANNKSHAEHLYEASRRTIHIYLESRKSQADNSTLSNQPSNPLWLIQSLTLSVIFGLFSDNENNVYIVIRQLNALNSLVKASVRSNRHILFAVNGEDEENLNIDRQKQNNSLFPNFSINDEIKFKNSIVLQSQVRIVFMIYRLTNFLLMMYNVPLSLSINDLGKLTCPSSDDETLWSFKSYHNFQEYHQLNHLERTLESYLSDENKFVFKDILKLVDPNIAENSALVHELLNLSKFGFTTLVHGLFEVKQYQEMKDVDMFSVLDNLTRCMKSKPTVNEYSKMQQDFEKLDYALLVNFTKISSLVDFKLAKEQSWLKNFDELTKNYNKSMLDSLNLVSEFDFLKIVDCSVMIIKLILFKTDDAIKGDEHENGLFNNDFDFLNLYNSDNNSLFKAASSNDFNPLMSDSHCENTSTNFEKMLNLKVFDEFDNSKNSIHSQMLFHVFMILSVFAIYMVKRNNSEEMMQDFQNLSFELNQRFKVTMELLNKIEEFLKVKYKGANTNVKLDNEFTNMCLYSSSSNVFSLEKVLYILKVGELTLSYMYESNMKVSIFKKLAGSLSQIRKFLIDNEARIVGS
ncbi:uncharacterized protein PRCAT00001134001 [Priceomyces carsonii]|uniref:uncharacterized protein n=1 Tax=Priceomyces carsonii TaxID=28549 RepID=UPI002ED7AFC6|nr:unnamed protein product [Priceomyces carsonii]